MAEFATRVARRIGELSAQQGLIRARATAETAALQSQIDTLVQVRDALTADPRLEVLIAQVLSLGIRIQET